MSFSSRNWEAINRRHGWNGVDVGYLSGRLMSRQNAGSSISG
jgi:hypothetical protein